MPGENFNNFKVFLELQRRNDEGMNDGAVNRIPLFVDNLGITTSKSVMAIPVPFSGAIQGESLNLAFDVGMAQKTINMSGQLLGQTIVKKRDGSAAKTVKMTSYEMAQLIHSYVDSSTFQDDQNMNKLIVLGPTRVGFNFDYHAGAENADVSDLKMMPFSWKTRGYDNSFTRYDYDAEAGTGANSEWFTPYTGAEEVSVGITGFIQNFNTTMDGSTFPAVGFTMDFTEAFVLSENFLDG
tara:strand:- start:1638 stop:2354 length:717 start_codon:yes stop_codon:yes gene_type:complete